MDAVMFLALVRALEHLNTNLGALLQSASRMSVLQQQTYKTNGRKRMILAAPAPGFYTGLAEERWRCLLKDVLVHHWVD